MVTQVVTQLTVCGSTGGMDIYNYDARYLLSSVFMLDNVFRYGRVVVGEKKELTLN